MKNIFLITLLIFLLMFVAISRVGGLDKGNMIAGVKGFIEFTGGSANKILRTDLTSGKTRELFSVKIDATNASIIGFDLSRDTRMRVMALNNSNGARIELFKDGKVLKTLVDHRHVRLPVFSPDDKKVAYVRSTHLKDSSMDWYLHTVNIDGSADRQVSARSLQQMRPSWFPDGKRIASGSRDLAVYVIDVASGNEQRIVDFGMAPSVSHDGTKIAYLSKDTSDKTKQRLRDHMMNKHLREYYVRTSEQQLMEIGKLLYYKSIYVYDIVSGKSTKLTKEMPLSAPVVWSPDDRYIAFNYDAVGRQIYILNIQTGKNYQMPDAQGNVMTWGAVDMGSGHGVSP